MTPYPFFRAHRPHPGLLLLFALAAARCLGGPPRPLAAAAPDRGGRISHPRDPQAELDKFWQNARREVYKSDTELLARHAHELERGLRFSKIMWGDRTKKQVAITFDDGPHPAYTPQILSILKQYHAKATFFVVGEMAEKHPELIRAELADGHNVGNHTYDHVDLTKIPSDYVATEIKACGEVIQEITGRAPHLFRPPGGDYDRNVAEVAELLGYTMVLWTDDPGDYASPGKERIRRRVLDRISNGGIVLIHDGIAQTIEVLPEILKYLNDRGYQCITIDEMLRSRKR